MEDNPKGIPLWWGYVHESGSIQVRRYFSELDTLEGEISPFTIRVFDAFEAESKDEALQILIDVLDNEKD